MKYVTRAGVLLIAALFVMMFATAASATVTTKTIDAKALTDHECNADQWQFVITGVDPIPAPASVTVHFSDGGTVVVPLQKVTGNVAHYVTTTHLDSTVTSATAVIESDWAGQFNLSDGPCNEPSTTTTSTTTTTVPVEQTTTTVTLETTTTTVPERTTSTTTTVPSTSPSTEGPTSVPGQPATPAHVTTTQLPRTGANTGWLAGVGVTTLLAGAALVLRKR